MLGDDGMVDNKETNDDRNITDVIRKDNQKETMSKEENDGEVDAVTSNDNKDVDVCEIERDCGKVNQDENVNLIEEDGEDSKSVNDADYNKDDAVIDADVVDKHLIKNDNDIAEDAPIDVNDKICFDIPIDNTENITMLTEDENDNLSNDTEDSNNVKPNNDQESIAVSDPDKPVDSENQNLIMDNEDRSSENYGDNIMDATTNPEGDTYEKGDQQDSIDIEVDDKEATNDTIITENRIENIDDQIHSTQQLGIHDDENIDEDITATTNEDDPDNNNKDISYGNTESDDELDRQYDASIKKREEMEDGSSDEFDMQYISGRKITTEEANRGFDNEEVAEYKEVFDYFDQDRKGHITSKHVATTLRALKPVPGEYLVMQKVEEIDKEMKGRVNFQQFLDVLHYVIRKAKATKRKRSCYTNLSEKQMAEIRDAFAMFDHDGDGSISAGELKSVMMNIGVYSTDEDVNDMVKELDADDSGSLDFPEFVSLMTRKISGAEVTNEMLEAFRYFDKDGDGTISAAEVRQVMDALGEDLSDIEIEEMIREADNKGKGGVSYEDFVKMITSQ